MTRKYENETSSSISTAAEWLERTKIKLLVLFPQQMND